jgi:hypothetical protein
MSPNDYFAYAALNVGGLPSGYTVYGDSLYLYPEPDVTATLSYFRTYLPTPIASTTATTAMPFSGEHDFALRSYVKARAYEQIGDDRWQLCDNLYQREVSETAFEVSKSRSVGLDPAPTEVY